MRGEVEEETPKEEMHLYVFYDVTFRCPHLLGIWRFPKREIEKTTSTLISNIFASKELHFHKLLVTILSLAK